MKLKMIFPKGIPLVGRWERNTRAHDTKELYARERYNPVFEYYYLVPRAARVPFLANALINSTKFHGHLRNSTPARFLSLNLPFDRGISIFFPYFIRTSVERNVFADVVHFGTPAREIPPRREENNLRRNVTSARPPMQRPIMKYIQPGK